MDSYTWGYTDARYRSVGSPQATRCRRFAAKPLTDTTESVWTAIPSSESTATIKSPAGLVPFDGQPRVTDHRQTQGYDPETTAAGRPGVR